MRSREDIVAAARKLQVRLREEFGLDYDAALVFASVRAKLESRLLERVDAVIESYTPSELAVFSDAWMRSGDKPENDQNTGG